MSARVSRDEVVPAGHPALDGHFPGYPIVPGVVIAMLAERFAREALGAQGRVTAVPAVKFVRAIGPDEPFVLTLEQAAGGELRFSAGRAGEICASGTLRFEA